MEKNIQSRTTKYGIALLISILIHTCSFAQSLDIRLLRSLSHRTSGGDALMVPVTNSVYQMAAALPLGELIYGYAKHDTSVVINGWQAVTGVGVNFVVAFGMKYAVNRARPYASYADINPYQHDTDPSFPSGHTSFAFETATMVTMQYPKWYIIVPSYAWASTVGYSRMYLGMHYPTDVLAGALVGTASAWLSIKGTQWLRNHKNKRLAIEPH